MVNSGLKGLTFYPHGIMSRYRDPQTLLHFFLVCGTKFIENANDAHSRNSLFTFSEKYPLRKTLGPTQAWKNTQVGFFRDATSFAGF